MPQPSRRHVMTGLAAAGFVPPAWTAHATDAPRSQITGVPSLGALAAERGVLFGTAFDIESIETAREAALYRHHSRILTTDLSLKFAALRPEEGPARFANADRLLAWSTEAGLPLRGHCLIWNDANPPWLDKLTAERRIYWFDRHIDEVMGRYAGKLHSWDVVNEPFWPGHRKPGLFRDGPWYSALGPAYVTRAIRRAAAADPGAKLIINESGPEWEVAWAGETKPTRAALLHLLDTVQSAGGRIDAVGLQCHWMKDFRFDADNFRAYIRQLAAKVREVYLTELDVDDHLIDGDQAARDAEVASRYTRLVSAALREPAVSTIITWQMADGASWITREKKMWRNPARPPRPTPFDSEYRPKAAYRALADAFRST